MQCNGNPNLKEHVDLRHSLPATDHLPVTDGRSKSNGLHSFCNSIKLAPKDTIYIHTVLIVKVYIVSETKSNHTTVFGTAPSPGHPPKPNRLWPLPNLVKGLSEVSSGDSKAFDGFGRRRLTFLLFINFGTRPGRKFSLILSWFKLEVRPVSCSSFSSKSLFRVFSIRI